MKFIRSGEKFEDANYWKMRAVEVMGWKLQLNGGDEGNT